VGEFNKEGLASAEVGADIGKVSILRLKVLKESSNWVILSEVNICFPYLPKLGSVSYIFRFISLNRQEVRHL
jgi:hypothetical protein